MRLKKEELHPYCFYNTSICGLGFMKLKWLGYIYYRTELGSILGYDKNDKNKRFWI